MMTILYGLVSKLHSVCGIAGLILFWFPALLRKGGYWHRRMGRYFALTMTVTGITGLIMAIMMYADPVGIKPRSSDLSEMAIAIITAQGRENAVFLTLLSVLLFTTVQSSLAAVRAKDDRRHVMLILPTTLGLFGLYVLGYSVRHGNFLFGGMAVLSLVLSALNLHYVLKARLRRNDWVLGHLGNALASGIVAHTGFLVFGASRLLGPYLPGNLSLIPWFAPAFIGIPIIAFLLVRHARV